jgi:undecaprenyl-diphosphatase
VDATLFSTINGLAGHVDSVDDIFEIIAFYGPFFMLAGLAVLWFWPSQRVDRDRHQWGVILAVLSAAIALGVNQIIIRLWDRPRPFVDHHAILLLKPSHDPSFPSDHATFAFAIAVALILTTRRIGWVALAVAVVMSFARVYTGEHYLGDVLGGALIATLVTLALQQLQPWLAPLLAWPLRLAQRLHLA